MALEISEPRAGVPVPVRSAGLRSPLSRALWELQPGECREVRGYRDHNTVMKRASVCGRIWPGRKYVTRKGDGFVTIWRVK